MRVAVLCTNFQPDNGWATVAVKRSAALMKLGVEIVAVTSKNDGKPVGIIPTDIRPILPLLRIKNSPARLLLSNPSVARSTSDCDLIDVVAEPYALSCILSSRHRPLAITAHGTYVPFTATNGSARHIYSWLYRRPNVHINAVSNYTARRVQHALGGSQPHIIPNGVDYDYFQSSDIKPAKQGPTVLSVGAVKARKGMHVLIKAIAHVRDRVPDVQCVIVGSLKKLRYVQRIVSLIEELQLQNTVHLMEHLPDDELLGWYQHADVFVLASLNSRYKFEGFGLVHLEANACGVPTIGSHETGSESAIIDGETGYLIEQGNTQMLAQRIIEILENDSLRSRLGQAARNHAQAHDWTHVAQRTLNFYESILST